MACYKGTFNLPLYDYPKVIISPLAMESEWAALGFLVFIYYLFIAVTLLSLHYETEVPILLIS
jgi:hypothetical protein